MSDIKRNILIAALAIILLIALIVGVWSLAASLSNKNNAPDDETSDNLTPDYPPQATDPNQSPMESDPGGELETSEGGGGVNLTYSSVAFVDLSEGSVSLYYANPSKSTQDMVVRLVVDDEIICSSQRLTPGNQIKSLPLNEEVIDKLAVGGYDAKYVVGCYDRVTSEKAAIELIGGGVVLTVTE